MATTKKQSFEDRLKRLEQIVQILEDETTNLEKSVKMFEEGIELSRKLTEELKEIKFKVSRLKKTAEGKLDLEESKV